MGTRVLRHWYVYSHVVLIKDAANGLEWNVWLVMEVVVACVGVPEEVPTQLTPQRQPRVTRQHVRCTAYTCIWAIILTVLLDIQTNYSYLTPIELKLYDYSTQYRELLSTVNSVTNLLEWRVPLQPRPRVHNEASSCIATEHAPPHHQQACAGIAIKVKK